MLHVKFSKIPKLSRHSRKLFKILYLASKYSSKTTTPFTWAASVYFTGDIHFLFVDYQFCTIKGQLCLLMMTMIWHQVRRYIACLVCTKHKSVFFFFFFFFGGGGVGVEFITISKAISTYKYLPGTNDFPPFEILDTYITC